MRGWENGIVMNRLNDFVQVCEEVLIIVRMHFFCEEKISF